MTKNAMVNFIEASGMVVNFSRSYFMHMDKASVERFYKSAVAFTEMQ